MCGAAWSSRCLMTVDQWPTRLRACVHASDRHFEHVTINLFSLNLIHFVFHIILDAASKILRVHYKGVKCDASFSQGSVDMLFL